MEESVNNLVIHRYAKKVDPVSAVQFTGGQVNGNQITEWVRSQGRGALWYPAVDGWDSPDGKNGFPASPEYISLRTPRGLKDVNVGDFIFQDAEGDFRSLKAGDFANAYAAV